MEWLFGLTFVPFLLCGLICLGGMALAVFGFRRDRDGGHPETPATAADRDEQSPAAPR